MKRTETLAEWSARTEANAALLEVRTHYVYRAFDDAGFLLYVGSTVNLASRMTAHRQSAAWYQFVADIGVETFHNRTSARASESEAILAEGAYFNRFPANQFTSDVTDAQELSTYLSARDAQLGLGTSA